MDSIRVPLDPDSTRYALSYLSMPERNVNDHTDRWMVCTAKRTDGTKCRAPAIKGGRVCNAHGGAAPHVRAAAAARIEKLVDPAISTLRQMMLRGETHTVRLKAAESVLDRAGIVADPATASQQTEVNVTVTYEDVAVARTIVREATTAPRLNGATHHADAPDPTA